MTLLYQSPVGTEAERNAGLIWPGTWRDANPYGTYYELMTGVFAYHTGADLNLPNNADEGQHCYAIAPGKVLFAERVCNSTWGNLIVLLHDDGTCSRYAHLKAFYVYRGQRVERGQALGVIGGVGKTLDQYVIVDGFHRYFVMKHNAALRERYHGRLPITVIDKPINDRMASTVRHNRARGKHSVQGMSNMVFQMLDNGWSDAEICNELGMEPEELLRLKHITGFSKLFAD